MSDRWLFLLALIFAIILGFLLAGAFDSALTT